MEGLVSLDLDILSFQTSIISDEPTELNATSCPSGNYWLDIDQSEARIWSWTASISIGRRASAGLFTCSGTIVSDKWVLTAADCCRGSIVDEMEVYTSSLEFRQGKMHRVKSYQTADKMCAIRLADHIDIDGMETSVGCFSNAEVSETCWIAAWKHSTIAQNQDNILKSVTVKPDRQSKTARSKCHSGSSIDFTGSPIMCIDNDIEQAVVSGIVWEDKGLKNNYAIKINQKTPVMIRLLSI